MGMHPDSGKLFNLSALINLPVEKIGHRGIIEGYGHAGAGLSYERHVFDVEQIIRSRNPKSADFRIAVIPQEDQLCPCSRAKSQGGRFIGC
jgi:hypothetical protein